MVDGDEEDTILFEFNVSGGGGIVTLFFWSCKDLQILSGWSGGSKSCPEIWAKCRNTSWMLSVVVTMTRGCVHIVKVTPREFA